MTGREIMAAVLVAFAAGPTVVAILKCLEAASSTHSDLWSTADAAAFVFSPVVGLIGGLPAAVAGSIAARILIMRNIDAAWVAVIAGGVLGAVLAVPCNIFGGSDAFALAMVAWIASTVLSLVYWIIAVRPYRRRRLGLVRDEEAIRAME